MRYIVVVLLIALTAAVACKKIEDSHPVTSPNQDIIKVGTGGNVTVIPYSHGERKYLVFIYQRGLEPGGIAVVELEPRDDGHDNYR